MSISDQPAPQTTPAPRRTIVRTLLIALVALTSLGILLSLDGGADTATGATTGPSVLALAAPALLAGMLSFLSPCCLPVLTAYFAYAAQTGRERLMLMTLAFFLGVATTMVMLGASATALSQLLFRTLPTLTLVGGLLIIAFGVMSLLGKGFGGLRIGGRADATVPGAYLFGATFALGWTACVGPILGALLTLLATQGVAVLQGATLAFIYTLGMGLPLFGLALVAGRLDRQSRAWRLMRGRGFSLNLGFTTLQLHTTSIISGLLLITMGVLLATGRMAEISRWALQTPLTQWVLGAEESMRRFFAGR